MDLYYNRQQPFSYPDKQAMQRETYIPYVYEPTDSFPHGSLAYH